MGVRDGHQWMSIVKEALNGVTILANYMCILHITNTHLLTFAYSVGPSMLPTLNLSGNIVIADRISVLSGKVGRGDIVLVRSPMNPRLVITKRVTAVEGDRVFFLADPKNSQTSQTVTVPKGHVWIQGDNLYASNDSRNFGPVAYGLLQARVFWRVWPLEGFGSLRQKEE